VAIRSTAATSFSRIRRSISSKPLALARSNVVEFVDASEVSSLYLETSYYVTPQKDTERAYEVLLAAFNEAKKAAVVRFVASGRQNYAVIQAIEGVLVLHTLYYADEVWPSSAGARAPSADGCA
jgi:non-homologous end joining protein Ku